MIDLSRENNNQQPNGSRVSRALPIKQDDLGTNPGFKKRTVGVA
jgi:hypothetical protein